MCRAAGESLGFFGLLGNKRQQLQICENKALDISFLTETRERFSVLF